MGKSLACLHNLFIFIKRVLLIISFILDLIIYYLLFTMLVRMEYGCMWSCSTFFVTEFCLNI